MFTIPDSFIISLTTGVLYIGPESIMPLATIIATVIGVILILWRYVISFVKRIYKYLYHKLLRKPLPESVALDLDTDDDVIVQDKPAEPEA